MNLHQQVAAGKLVSPKTRKRLLWDDTSRSLTTSDDSETYRLLDGKVPVLLSDEGLAASYTSIAPASTESFLHKAKPKLIRDSRSHESIEAFRQIIDEAPEGALCLSVGGGPTKNSRKLFNLNISPLADVDVVADAHRLPYSDGSVDAIYCEAVLEHLNDPHLAVREMFRVLRPGGKALAVTPFIQPYHGHPHHYQNFTLKGHATLFESAGFQIIESGTCVGPTFALSVLIYNYLREYVPLGKILAPIFGGFALLFTPFDKLINRAPNAHIIASTTYVVAGKNEDNGALGN